MRFQDSNVQSIALMIAFSVLAGTHIGCQQMRSWSAKPQEMHSVSETSASEGTVKVSIADNGNTKVSIRVKHLAPPSKVAVDSTVYVVWIQPREGDRQNVGALTLNKDLEGNLETLTPHRRFMVSVTPEPNGQVTEPSHEPVFTYNVESNK